MVRATDLPVFSDFVDIKLDEDHAPFGVFEMSLLAAQASWTDDSPPDTPRVGSPEVVSFADSLLVDSLIKSVERNGDLVLEDPLSPKSKSPCSVMWNMDNSPLDPSFKLSPSSTVPSHMSPCEYVKSPVTLEFELFALEEVSSDEDIFGKDIGAGSKRKSTSTVESMETKKAKARQTRDALSAEAQLRGLSADHPDTKRMTHNVLERKRRNDLKASYQDLRENIPELASQERAPTAQILQKAVEYIEYLKQAEDQMQVAMTAMRAENERLRMLHARA